MTMESKIVTSGSPVYLWARSSSTPATITGGLFWWKGAAAVWWPKEADNAICLSRLQALERLKREITYATCSERYTKRKGPRTGNRTSFRHDNVLQGVPLQPSFPFPLLQFQEAAGHRMLCQTLLPGAPCCQNLHQRNGDSKTTNCTLHHRKKTERIRGGACATSS
mmetsp:Transcript_23921/g.55815  ORF Transcript_23921/g.55815 Transcript_23921/m.55815 type:complete len:166 (+) Transcript_23921:466-963(+)